MKISTRLILYLVSAVVSVMTVYALYTLSRTQERLHGEMAKMAEHLGMALSVGLAHHLAAGDTAGVALLLWRVAQYEDVAGIVVLHPGGRVIAASSRRAAAELAPGPADSARVGSSSASPRAGERALPAWRYRHDRVIRAADGAPLGTLRLALTGQTLMAGVIETRNHILAAILALTVVLTALIIVFSRRYLVLPLTQLSARAEALGRGELDQRLDPRPDWGSELVQVADAFNSMAAGLQTRERELLREREYIRSIVDSVAEGVLVVDGQTRITVWNQTLHLRCGLSTTAVLGRPLGEVFPEFSAGSLHARLRDLLRRGTPFQVLQMNLAADPDRKLALSATARRNAEGQVDGAVVILVDITARLELEQRMQQSQKLAVAGQLAAGIAHEIGTPLNVISGSAEYVRMTLEEEDARREELGVIVDEVGRISHLVQQLLAFARQQEPVVEDVDVADVVEAVLRLVRGQLERRGVRVIVDLAKDLPRLRADAGQLQQVLLNLVMNAWQAMPEGGTLTLRAYRSPQVEGNGDGQADGRAESLTEDMDTVALSVHDTGHGIDPENLPRIFEPFFTTKDVGQGTGLGLSIVHRIVENHGGSVQVKSDPGRGTTFTVVLPVSPPGGRTEGAES